MLDDKYRDPRMFLGTPPHKSNRSLSSSIEHSASSPQAHLIFNISSQLQGGTTSLRGELRLSQFLSSAAKPPMRACPGEVITMRLILGSSSGSVVSPMDQISITSSSCANCETSPSSKSLVTTSHP